MAHKGCDCGKEDAGKGCSCPADDIFAYRCDTCNRSVPDKRCPYCGLKARRKKP